LERTGKRQEREARGIFGKGSVIGGGGRSERVGLGSQEAADGQTNFVAPKRVYLLVFLVVMRL
jgi:hypothetical protein